MLKNIFGIPVRKSAEIRKSRSRTLFWGGFDGCTLIAPRTLDGGLQSFVDPNTHMRALLGFQWSFLAMIEPLGFLVWPESEKKGPGRDKKLDVGPHGCTLTAPRRLNGGLYKHDGLHEHDSRTFGLLTIIFGCDTQPPTSSKDPGLV